MHVELFVAATDAGEGVAVRLKVLPLRWNPSSVGGEGCCLEGLSASQLLMKLAVQFLCHSA